jgi:GTP-binding protein
MNVPVVALVGRPNVGKSSLFNRLTGDEDAIVSEEAGTTRDRNFARAEWNGRAFWLVDTGGLPEDDRGINASIRIQVEQAIAEADVLLFVADAQVGMHPQDARMTELLRQSGKPFLLVANKVDDPQRTDFYDLYRLGAGDPHPVSAINGKQTGDLLDAIVELLPDGDEPAEGTLRVAVVGRPNVGKSSLVNTLLGEERLVVSDQAGTTRDSIDTPLTYHGRLFTFIDTAGLRRQARVDDGVEFYSTLRTRRALERSDVAVLVVDAVEGLHNQDLKIATLAWDAGRSLILVVNKWDLYEKDDKSTAKFEKACREKAPFLQWVPFLFVSAVTGQRVTRLLELLLEVEQERQKRISTSQINDTLQELLARRQPPQAAGREVTLKYATQVETEPPTIAIFGNAPDLVVEHYIRFLHNGFRAAHGFLGAPLRILLKRKSGD